jgi:hypothetical protein
MAETGRYHCDRCGRRRDAVVGWTHTRSDLQTPLNTEAARCGG